MLYKMPMVIGSVASLHLHPDVSGDLMINVDSLELIADVGIKRNGGNRNYGNNGRRQVSLIEREVLSEHAVDLAIPYFYPGQIRANIETKGINLVELIGSNIGIGKTKLQIIEARTPCDKMDKIFPGLRKKMEHEKQGVLAEVIESGIIQEGNKIIPLD